MQTSGEGYTTRIEGEKLIIEVDLTQPGFRSGSGKSMVIASSRGNQTVGPENLKLGLNVYRPIR